jgi:hypothetical protein
VAVAVDHHIQAQQTLEVVVLAVVVRAVHIRLMVLRGLPTQAVVGVVQVLYLGLTVLVGLVVQE